MNKKIIVGIVVLVVLIAGVGVGVYLVRQQQDIRDQAAPATTLTVVPESASVDVGDSFNAAIEINTAENQVVGTELYINFDPDVLEAEEINQGSFFSNPQTVGPDINNSAGTISYTLFLSPGSQPQTGTGTVANITFNALTGGTSSIGLSQDTIVVAVGEDAQNVLQTINPATVSVTQQVQPSATPVPSATPTDQQQSQDTGTGGGEQTVPSATPSPSPSPTPTDVDAGLGGGEPTATPSPSPTPTDSNIALGGGDVTSTPTTDSQNPATSKGDTELPDTGVSYPTIFGLGALFIALFGLFAFAIID